MTNIHVISLRETPGKAKAISDHLTGYGLQHTVVNGINASKWGISSSHKLILNPDQREESCPPKHTGLHLSHYLCWTLLKHSQERLMTVMEDDCRLVSDWRKVYQDAAKHTPHDWDIVLLGSAHTDYRNKRHISGPVWEVWWPMTTHCYMINRKCVEFVMESQEFSFAPIDICLTHRTYPRLKVYTILPRIAYQEGMELPA